MKVDLFFGPDKSPFELTSGGRAVALDGSVPFHGIISRGLLKACSRLGWQPSWNELAHKMHAHVPGPEDTRLQRLRHLANKCGVLSFEASTTMALTYIMQHALDNRQAPDTMELWNIKEGHTSSVWKVDITSRAGNQTFVLNVARDREAGKELWRTSRKMQRIGNKVGHVGMAAVLDMKRLRLPGAPHDVVVTRNTWVPDAFEIHTRNTGNSKEDVEFLLVERFITRQDAPAAITQIYGRCCSASEKTKIRNDIELFINTATTSSKEPVAISLNDGDVVWNGQEAIVVAIN